MSKPHSESDSKVDAWVAVVLLVMVVSAAIFWVSSL